MQLIAVYSLFVVIGDFISYGIGRALEPFVSGATSLTVFLACFFAVFVIAWKIAVIATEPRKPRRRFNPVRSSARA